MSVVDTASSSSPFEWVSGVVALEPVDAPEGFRRRRRLRDADPDEVRSPDPGVAAVSSSWAA
jgi:hypothetical protein